MIRFILISYLVGVFVTFLFALFQRWENPSLWSAKKALAMTLLWPFAVGFVVTVLVQDFMEKK